MPTYNKYNFDGKQLGKSRLILAIMKKFVRENNPNYEQLKQNFSEIEKDRRSLFITPLELAKKKEGSKDSRKRFFEADDEALTLSDISKVYVSNQWSKAGTEKVIRFVNSKFDYGISDVIQQQSINDLYIDYLKEPDKEWITAYQQFTEEVKNNLGVAETDLATNFINKLWKPESNGIASAKPGTLSNEEYQKLIDDLPKITALIFKEPSSNTLEKVYEWADEAKTEGKFNTVKRGVIHRVFAAADPKKYNTILNIHALRAFTKYLNDAFDLGINVSWNWAELNQVVTEKIKSKVEEPENELVFNTFIWWLFEKLKQESDDESLYIDEDERDLSMSTKRNQAQQKAVNLIYYGPPGTGKTYTLQKILKEQYTETGTSEEPEVWLNNKLSELSWFEIITLILLDIDKEVSVTEIVNHEYFTKKLALNGRTANIRQTAWAALQTHAIQDSNTVKYAKRIEPLIFDKDTDSKWIIVDKENELIVGYREQLNELKAGPPVEKEIKRFEFVTFHQSYGYEEFIEGLRPVTNDDGDISYIVKPGILKRLCKRAEADPKHQYALVIDEINRGNISKIFGELITLIEIDKRAGEEHELSVTLPYSNLSFSVPSNLDIIGTMNTADRSLTHIDIALRRRFEFKELRTDYSLLSDNVDGINLRKLLFTINKRIELLLDREHIIGHALLMNVSNLAGLKQVFISNIMPLLEEYFFEDWDKIKQVFNGNGFVSELKDAHTTWLGDANEYAAKSYFVDPKAFDEIENYTAVYQGIDGKNFAALFSGQEQN
ncbi:AAA family ATPase [Pseudoalteromonas shioyasakiensis]|uniref:AAA family ATPase n=1 Tax=Pseudoalteromonas shioyasakiensis TaxID=1190813 RepID=A0ABT6TUN4_9GAMM|nr:MULTISPECIES: AAA family ATPase [Pseudoalteromonas]MDI4667619.1 AAA family ATPase [Pseudoalteromonas shioyasakiensis]MDI4673150.1 AAA family ATPase [Pseudoalteromonas shioyasakiensis]MDI4685215.1 AAA family ATPase [Pseudoalteromonas shioyasakiensis]MDI4705058.1 AAA family ATPase [Pseudoalteromonas shioyasakiensis]NUJ20551.1 AAA family ATPase [Pseudoalteromonas sp. 0802]